MKYYYRLSTWTILSAYNKIWLVVLVFLSFFYHPLIVAAILYNRIKQKKQEMHRSHYRSDTDHVFGQR
jgi:hypothetical protein